MGSSLTGTKINQTYDSLIKVSDNGALDGTLQTLTDGLGNDSALSLSTAGASVTGTLAVSGGITGTLSTAAQTNITSVGTLSSLAVSGSSSSIVSVNTTSAIGTSVPFAQSGTNIGWIGNGSSSFIGASTSDFGINSQGNLLFGQGGFERMRIDSSGNVGIGTSSPPQKLTVAGDLGITSASNTRFSLNNTSALNFSIYSSNGSQLIIGQTGIADYLAVNSSGNLIVLQNGSGIDFSASAGGGSSSSLLDDYEEGTWTMGVSFGGAAVGVTYTLNTGTYTKIGRQVTVNGYLSLTSKGSSVGAALITGLPFTIANGASFYAPTCLRLNKITFANQFQGIAIINSTTIQLEEITTLGAFSAITDADFANDSEVVVSLTYFV